MNRVGYFLRDSCLAPFFICKNIENYIRIREKNNQAFDYLDEFEVG